MPAVGHEPAAGCCWNCGTSSWTSRRLRLRKHSRGPPDSLRGSSVLSRTRSGPLLVTVVFFYSRHCRSIRSWSLSKVFGTLVTVEILGRVRARGVSKPPKPAAQPKPGRSNPKSALNPALSLSEGGSTRIVMSLKLLEQRMLQRT